MDCRVKRVTPYRTTTEPPEHHWLQTMAKLGAGALSLSHLGGTFRFRNSPIHNLMQWGAYWNLEVLPGSPLVYEHWIVHRLLIQGVSISTVEQDLIAISVLHSSLKASIPGLWWHNPTKQDLIRIFVKHLTKEVKLPCEVTVPFSFLNFVLMVQALDVKVPLQLHTRIVIQTLGLPGLRRVAAANLYMVRFPPVIRSLDFDPRKSDVVIDWVDGYDWCVGFCVNIDKNIPAGRHRWIFIPGRMVCGLSFGNDVRLWLSTYPVPDGPFLAAPTGSRALKFNSTPYTAFDRAIARAVAN